MVRILHLSDPHFGTIHPEVYEALLRAVKRAKPDLVLISGDITQRARRSQFEAAREFKQALLPVRSFAVPGNHDIPLFNLLGRLLAPYHGFHKYFQSRRETDFRIKGIRILGLNSTSRWRHVQGSLDRGRIQERLFGKWEEASIRIVAVHHPLDCSKRIDDKNLMRGREATLQMFEEAEIDLVLSGHIHDPFVTLSDGRYRESRRPMVLSIAGTCLSWRTREEAPNSFHQIDIETSPATITTTRFDLMDSKEFEEVPNEGTRFERGSHGWSV